MKTTLKRSLFFISIALFSLVACSDDDDGGTPQTNNPGGNNPGGGNDTIVLQNTLKASINNVNRNYTILAKNLISENISIIGEFKPDTTGRNDERIIITIPEDTRIGNLTFPQTTSVVITIVRGTAQTFFTNSGFINISKLDTINNKLEASFELEMSPIFGTDRISLKNGEINLTYQE